MRGIVSCVCGLLLVSVCIGQEAPAVDLKDPTAVALAYAKACRDADLKTVLELLAPDDPSRARLQEMQGQADVTDARAGVAAMLREYLFLPLGVQAEQKAAGATEEGDRAEVKLTATSEIQQTFVLAGAAGRDPRDAERERRWRDATARGDPRRPHRRR